MAVAVGNFSSPGFPVSLPVHHFFCEWRTDSGASSRVQLDFHVVDLPQSTVDGRSTSYLSYGDFNSRGLRVEHRRVDGSHNKTLRPFTSAGQSAWVTLVSTGDPRKQHQGLLVEVRHLRDGQLLWAVVSLFFRCCEVNYIKSVASKCKYNIS